MLAVQLQIGVHVTILAYEVSLVIVGLSLLCLTACGHVNTTPANTAAQPSATQYDPKDGDYFGTGKVTKIDNKIGSVEMDHGDIQGLMPAMRMEFYVSDKALLSDLAVGDNVNFTILYKGGTETITKIVKTK